MSNEELALLAQQGDTVACGTLWEQNQGILTKLMAQYFPLCKHYRCEPDDLLQCGYFVICRAAEAYRPEKGLKFTSYLFHHTQAAVRETFCTRSRKKRLWDVSGNTLVDDEGECELLDVQPDPEAAHAFEEVEAEIYREQLHDVLGLCMAELGAAKAEILHRRYYRREARSEIGLEMGLSEGKVRNEERAALERLRRDRRVRGYREDVITRHVYRGGLGLFRDKQASSVEWTVEKLVEREL